MPQGTCFVVENNVRCDGIARGRGMCQKHYARWLKNGDPLVTRAARYPADSTCKVQECGKRPVSAGYCRPHYDGWRRHGDPLASRPRMVYAAGETCLVEECGRRPAGRGYCSRHLDNLLRSGNPVPRSDRPLEARLREVGWDITERGCWEWRGKRDVHGYGMFSAKRLGYQGARAHRVMYEHAVDVIPDGLELRHRCDNPPCVNPDHLIPGTHAENMADMVERGRHWMHGRTRCVNGHDLTLPGAVKQYDGVNRCTECHRKAGRKSKERLRGGRPARKPRLTSEQAADIRQRRAAGESLTGLAGEYGISVQLACDIAKGRRYRDDPPSAA